MSKIQFFTSSLGSKKDLKKYIYLLIPCIFGSAGQANRGWLIAMEMSV